MLRCSIKGWNESVDLTPRDLSTERLIKNTAFGVGLLLIVIRLYVEHYR